MRITFRGLDIVAGKEYLMRMTKKYQKKFDLPVVDDTYGS